MQRGVILVVNCELIQAFIYLQASERLINYLTHSSKYNRKTHFLTSASKILINHPRVRHRHQLLFEITAIIIYKDLMQVCHKAKILFKQVVFLVSIPMYTVKIFHSIK